MQSPTTTPFRTSCRERWTRFADHTGRRYRLFDYVGAADATEVIVVMGSGAATVERTVEAMVARGEKVGLLKVRLYRPFATAGLVAALPSHRRDDRSARPHQGARCRRRAPAHRHDGSGDRGDPGRPDVLARVPPRVIGGRFGLSSKEFTPAHGCLPSSPRLARTTRSVDSPSASSTT